MARKVERTATTSEFDIDALSTEVASRFDDVPWKLFDSNDLASSGETRFMVSRIQADLLKVASVDPNRAGQIWDEHVPDFVPRPAGLPDLEQEDTPVNAMEPGRRRRKLQGEPFLDPVSSPDNGPDLKAASRPEIQNAPGASREVARLIPQGASSSKDDRDDERVRLLLDGLNKQYLKADDKYHFRDKSGDVAFQVQKKKLVTQHDTPSVVSSMIDLAETRGWSSLKLTGTQEFRREAWLQANLRDVEVSGYQPSKLDKVKLEELRQERATTAPANSISQEGSKARNHNALPSFEPVVEDGKGEPKVPLTPAQDQFLRLMEATMRHRGDAPAAIAKARELANERLTSDRIYVGKLVEVGTAPYQDKSGEKPSHFVALEDSQGQRTKVWGVDLPRALAASGAEPGQVVAVAFKGRQPVSVDVPTLDQAGKVVRTERQTVDRNTWDVVPFERLREQAKASVLKAVQRQENPADLKVFDRSTRPVKPTLDLTRQPSRGRERSL